MQGGCASIKCHLSTWCRTPSWVTKLVSPERYWVTSPCMCHDGYPLGRHVCMSHEKALKPRERKAVHSAWLSSHAISTLISSGVISSGVLLERAREPLGERASAGACPREGLFLCTWGFWSYGFGNPTAVLLYRLFLRQNGRVLSLMSSSFLTSRMSIAASVWTPDVRSDMATRRA